MPYALCPNPCALSPTCSVKARRLAKAAIFLIGITILSSIICPQEVRAQEITDYEISVLEKQLNEIEARLVSLDEELQLLDEGFNKVTNEINKLKQELRLEEAKPKGILNRITGIFSYRKRGKLEKLLTDSQELADKISNRQKRREPLINEFVGLADELIDKSSLRMKVLMDVVRDADLRDDIEARDEAWKQVSVLWQLAERTTTARNKYAPRTFIPERVIALPSLLSDDPEELRLGAAIWKDEAMGARDDAAKLEREIEDLQQRKLLLEKGMEVASEMQRRDEERGAVGVGAATSIPWVSDVAAEREIAEIEIMIAELSAKKQEYEDKAKRFESQSEILEQRASEIDAQLKGKPEND